MKSAYRLTGSSSARREPTRFDSDVKLNISILSLKTNLKEFYFCTSICKATLREEKKPEKIEEQQSARKRFQKLGQSVLQDIHIPNREEQFDFFTSNKFVQEPSGVTVPTSTTAEATTTSEIVQADTETTLLLQGDEGVETVYTKAVYLSHEKKKDLDGKLYFFPSSKNSKN
jgi:YHS domain-containing protein